MRNLDVDYPMGNPDSLVCRHCHNVRERKNGALMCAVCDGAALTQGAQ